MLILSNASSGIAQCPSCPRDTAKSSRCCCCGVLSLSSSTPMVKRPLQHAAQQRRTEAETLLKEIQRQQGNLVVSGKFLTYVHVKYFVHKPSTR